jgi:hypothetical protein
MKILVAKIVLSALAAIFLGASGMAAEQNDSTTMLQAMLIGLIAMVLAIWM